MYFCLNYGDLNSIKIFIQYLYVYLKVSFKVFFHYIYIYIHSKGKAKVGRES